MKIPKFLSKSVNIALSSKALLLPISCSKQILKFEGVPFIVGVRKVSRTSYTIKEILQLFHFRILVIPGEYAQIPEQFGKNCLEVKGVGQFY